jgi:hypothetical protein
LILGASLIFWGTMTGRPFTGVFLAVLVESFHWLKIRWDFDEDACATAWKITTIAIAITAALIYLDGSPYTALPKLLTWLPLLLLPMQFVQSFGLKNSMPLITFSFLARQRRLRNQRLGLTTEMIHLHFGNVYFVAILVASTLGGKSSTWMFLPAMIILTGWMLLSESRSRPIALVVALTIAGGIAVAGQLGLEELEQWLGNRGPERGTFDPNYVSTLIGRPVSVQQSPDIVWRLKPLSGTAPPRLIRSATYNSFHASSWVIDPVSAKTFNNLDAVTYQGESSYILEQHPDESKSAVEVARKLPQFELRGAAFADTPLPLPGNAVDLLDFELDGIEHNAMGTVLVSPMQSVIDGTVRWKGEVHTEEDPYDDDLIVPRLEKPTLRKILAELKLDEQPDLANKLRVVHLWFADHFSYTRDLTIKSWTQISKPPTAITQFLTTVRSGHCEYFAAATALLLREAGIPTRYATGYAVQERDAKHGEFIIRGTHGHAWCRVWDETSENWIDFDTTPSSWIGVAAKMNPPMQSFNDMLKRFREDFFLWRNRPANRLGASLVMSAIALGVAGFVFRRLWKSKQRLEEEKKSNGYAEPIRRTPLNALEKQIESQLGARPVGQPFGEWILQLKPVIPDSGILDEAVGLHQRLRFDPAPAAPSDLARLEELAKDLESTLKHGRI